MSAVTCWVCGVVTAACNQLRLCETSAAQQQQQLAAIRGRNPGAAAAIRRRAEGATWGSKSQQGGHSLPIREIQEDRGHSAAPISTRGHWTAAAAGWRPGTLIIITFIIITLSSLRPGLHRGTELNTLRPRWRIYVNACWLTALNVSTRCSTSTSVCHNQIFKYIQTLPACSLIDCSHQINVVPQNK